MIRDPKNPVQWPATAVATEVSQRDSVRETYLVRKLCHPITVIVYHGFFRSSQPGSAVSLKGSRRASSGIKRDASDFMSLINEMADLSRMLCRYLQFVPQWKVFREQLFTLFLTFRLFEMVLVSLLSSWLTCCCADLTSRRAEGAEEVRNLKKNWEICYHLTHGKCWFYTQLSYKLTATFLLGHPVLWRDPLWSCRIFFFVCVVFFCFFLLPPPKMAFLEAKHMQGNHGLTWYVRKTFL